MTISSNTKKKLLPTINELLYGIETGTVSSIDKNKLDESTLRYICEHVLNVDLTEIPKTAFAVKDFRAVFLHDWADDLTKYKTDLEALAGRIAENKLTYHFSHDDLICKLEISNEIHEATFDKNTDAGSVLSLLLEKNGFVAMEKLVKATYPDSRRATAITKKKVQEAIRNIRKKLGVYKTANDDFIEADGNRYRLTVPVVLKK